MSAISLLRCPFCEGEPRLCSNSAHGMHWVLCMACHASPGDRPSQLEAVEAWNTRTGHAADSALGDIGRVIRPGFQAEVSEWMLACFGPEVSDDKLERADRFTEEALELAQTIPGFTADRAHALVDYVFARPVGQRGQEVGGTMVTMAALCNTFGVGIVEEAERELARVWTKIDDIRAKQAAKPTGSALPVAVAETGK